MASKSSSAQRSQSSFISQELLGQDQIGRLSLKNSTVLVEPLGKGKSPSSGIQIGTVRPIQTNQWWTLFASIPKDANPLSLDNEGVIDDIRQPGGVHFLGGIFNTGGAVERDVFVAQNQSIVLPILTVGADNVGWDFGEDYPIPYQFSLSDLKTIADAIMDTATGVSLFVNGDPLINGYNMSKFRLASNSKYTLNLPENDIFGYRDSYAPEYVKPPYTQGVQDGFWVEIRNLSLGEHTIRFTGTINYNEIDVRDYNNSGVTGDTPLEALLAYVQDEFQTTSYDVTYNVDVLSRPEFNAQLRMLG